jgi:broad specificity phosphatase PhoE
MATIKSRLILVRHCLTDYDIAGSNGRFLGTSDPILNNDGITEAIKLRALLKDVPIDQSFVGDAIRCQQTLQYIIEKRNIPISVDPLLNEIDYGVWEGLTKREIIENYKNEWELFQLDPSINIPSMGELPSECLERADKWLSHVNCSYGLAVIDKTILRLLICSTLGLPLSRYRNVFDIKIAGITVFLNTEQGWRLETLNYAATPKRVFGV